MGTQAITPGRAEQPSAVVTCIGCGGGGARPAGCFSVPVIHYEELSVDVSESPCFNTISIVLSISFLLLFHKSAPEQDPEL